MNVPNTFDGRQGDDILNGGNAGDTYAFSAEYDFDIIRERPDAAGVIDKVVFGASVERDALIVRRDGLDINIDLGNGTDILKIEGGLGTTRIEEFHFADGSVMTLEQLIDRLLTGTEADEQFTGFDNRADTISGGGGSDALAGGQGNDTYKYGLGDGSDSVSDSSGIDQIVFGAGLTRDNVEFRNVDGDLLITLESGTDRLVVLGGYKLNPVENFVFADGTSLGIAEVRDLIRQGEANGSQD